jgi:hypothetical protein
MVRGAERWLVLVVVPLRWRVVVVAAVGAFVGFAFVAGDDASHLLGRTLVALSLVVGVAVVRGDEGCSVAFEGVH